MQITIDKLARIVLLFKVLFENSSKVEGRPETMNAKEKQKFKTTERNKAGVIQVVRRRKKPPLTNQCELYRKMVGKLRQNPYDVIKHVGIFASIFNQLAGKYGELVIENGGKNAYFAREGISFTDFGVVVLSVVHQHSVAKVKHFVELLILGGTVEPKVISVETSLLQTGQWIEDLGPGYIYERKELWSLKALIQTMAKYAPEGNQYQYTGWIVGGNIYSFAGIQLHGGDWNMEQAEVSCKHVLQMLDVAQHSLTIPLLAIELLSLVHSRMMEKGTYFKGVCCIVAPTQSFKTALASLFFDAENGREANANFEATMTALIRTVGNIRDSTAVIDDFKPGTTKAEYNDMVLKLSKIIRMCSDDSGGIKKAGAQNTTTVDIAQCLVVVTAEQIQLKVQSTLARLLILETTRKCVDKEKLTFFQVNHLRYRRFIKDFIAYICSQGVDSYCDILIRQFMQKRDTFRVELAMRNVSVDNRTNDMCMWLYVSFSEFLKYTLQNSVIGQEQFKQYMDEARNIFQSIMERQAERVADLDETRQFFKGLQILLETKEAHIGKLQARNVCYSTADSQEAVGFSKKGFVYLKNEVALQKVISYYRRMGKEFFISETVLRKALAESGSIVPKNEKTYIHRLYVNQKTYQCIKFSEHKFSELLNGGNKNGTENNRGVPGNWGMRQNADSLLGRRD